MKVFQLQGDADRFAWITPSDEQANRFLINILFDGSRMSSQWRPLHVRRIREGDNDKRPIGDFPILSGLPPVLSERAKQCLSSLWRGKCEFLPITSAFGTFYLLNVLNVIDALDKKKSHLRCFKEHIMQVHRHEFIAGAFKEDETLFKIPMPLYPVYVTELTSMEIARCELAGCTLTEVWRSAASE